MINLTELSSDQKYALALPRFIYNSVGLLVFGKKATVTKIIIETIFDDTNNPDIADYELSKF